MQRPRSFFASCALLVALAIGCSYTGYSIETHTSALADDAPRIAIATLDNDSSEPGVERLVSEALRRETLRRGRYRLVDELSGADWVLRGRVLPVERRTQTLSSVVLALEQTISLTVELELARPGQAAGKRAIAPFTESEIFFASADIEAARKNRIEALRRVSGLLAQRAHDAVDAEWAQ